MAARIALCLGAALAVISSRADAGVASCPAEAERIADAAVAHIAKVGWSRALRDFRSDAAHWGKNGIHVFDLDGVRSDRARPAVKGAPVARAPGGIVAGLDLVGLAGSGGGWVDYLWAQPQTNQLAERSTYLRKVPGRDAVVGVDYRRRAEQWVAGVDYYR
jgi:cytochrome c